MRFLHLGDLHFGKRIDNLSLIEDQRYVIEKIYEVIDEKKIDAVLIAGDVYDKAVPAEEAVGIFDDFLYGLAKRGLPVMVIAGNHDSAERLSFGDRLIEATGIYISPVYEGRVKKVTLTDEFGPVNFYLLPFVRPAAVRHCFPEETINSYTEAVGTAVRRMDIDPSERNVILSHQFVTGAKQDGSEDELYVGGTANVDSSAYGVFDYAALGHIHSPQAIDSDKIRYCGSPMKYSFNEERQQKGLTVVDLKEKGELSVEVLPLSPLRDFITIKGKYDELKNGSADVREQDFVSVILTDEDDVPNAFSNLSIVYPGLQRLSYDNTRTRNTAVADGGGIDPELRPIDLIKDFYKLRNGQEMNGEQTDYIVKLIEKIWGGQE